MAATGEVAGRGGARASRPGRARTTCEGGGIRILDGRADRASGPRGAVFDLSGPDLRIALVDAERRTLLDLGAFPEEDVIATWRSLCRSAGLVPMMKSHDDAEELGRSLGGLRLGGSPHARRKRALSGRRRPRFLARRKISRLPNRPLVHRESEMATGRAD